MLLFFKSCKISLATTFVLVTLFNSVICLVKRMIFPYCVKWLEFLDLRKSSQYFGHNLFKNKPFCEIHFLKLCIILVATTFIYITFSKTENILVKIPFYLTVFFKLRILTLKIDHCILAITSSNFHLFEKLFFLNSIGRKDLQLSL